MATSRPGVYQSVFERSYRDRCELAFILLRDGQVYDLSEHSYKLHFYRTSFFHQPLLSVDLSVFGSKISVVLTAEQKSLLREQDVLFSLTRSDDKTLSEGILTWKVKKDSKVFNPPDIIINFDTISGEAILQLGYLYIDGSNVEIVESLTQEAKQARNEAVDARTGAENAETGAVAAKTGAETARTGAETARTGAENAETGAIAAKTGAEAARTDAETARTGAENAETGAIAAKTGAEEARTGAETARTGAENAETGAVAAKTGAEAARTGAETARTGAEDARDEVSAIKDSFIRNNTDVFGAKVTAIVSLTQTEFDDLPLKLNTTMYVVSDDPTGVILQLVGLTQAEYDGLLDTDEETLYLIEYAA